MEQLKSSIMQDFRDALGVNSSPSQLDASVPPTPVAIVGGNIGYVKPRSNQKIFSAEVQQSGAGTTSVQCATPTATTRVFLLGCCFVYTTGGSVNWYVYDGVSGTFAGTNALVVQGAATALPTPSPTWLPAPLEVKSGLRAQSTVATAGIGTMYVIYMVEDTSA